MQNIYERIGTLRIVPVIAIEDFSEGFVCLFC